MDELVAVTKAQPKADGFAEILIPGEREERCRAARLKGGIPLSEEVLEALNREAERAGRAPLSAEPMQGADLN
jgi:LDH2 family malate/lactate/ureidoglycolate dehydrogenase